MLVFTRRLGEQIQIGDQITVTVTRVDDGQVRIGIEAPAGVTIVREELLVDRPAQSGSKRRRVRDSK